MPQGSGPPYPHPNPAPGSNQIGQFQIGISPVGTIPAFDVWQTVLAQYANSKILTQLITDMAQYVDPTRDLDAFYDTIWNVDTAIGYGLDVWGRIVGLISGRTIQLASGPKFFGFAEAGGASADPFGQSPFFSGQQITTNFNLADGPFRTLIFAKALANITDGSTKSINQIMLNLFPGRGNCFVVDNGDLTMVYNFLFGLSSVELAIVSQTGVLPRPPGVAATVQHL